MHRHKLLDDCQAQAEAGVGLNLSAVRLPETLENEGQLFGANADAVIADGNIDHVGLADGADARTVEQVYAFGLNGIFEIFSPDRAFVALAESEPGIGPSGPATG